MNKQQLIRFYASTKNTLRISGIDNASAHNLSAGNIREIAQ
ncbi:hypothetical protein ACFFJN_17755 [Erwinia mallotivora]